VSTVLLGGKYRVHPIYSICLFLDVRIESSCGANHAQTPLEHFLSGYGMADLVLQDFENLFQMPQRGILLLDAQESIPYRSNPKKEVLITSPHHYQPAGDSLRQLPHD
jgi:hypothetical protein